VNRGEKGREREGALRKEREGAMKSTKANPKPGVDPKIVMYTRERKYNDLQIIEFTLHTFKSTVNRKKITHKEITSSCDIATRKSQTHSHSSQNLYRRKVIFQIFLAHCSAFFLSRVASKQFHIV